MCSMLTMLQEFFLYPFHFHLLYWNCWDVTKQERKRKSLFEMDRSNEGSRYREVR